MSAKKIYWCIVALLFAGKTMAEINNTDAVNDLVKRVMQDKAQYFVTAIIPRENGRDVFELESGNGKIILRGSNGLSIASALNYYLQHYCHCIIT
ncbi:MAG TPA: alpha-N-acetylglucosaminidase N-terminal domain-containing protein [Chitinophagaceae bacterium]|nr:alpha-N-acetylglucosaminidase N-terminal domain-containing protein [Chitinophagaceae bacterium]